MYCSFTQAVGSDRIWPLLDPANAANSATENGKRRTSSEEVGVENGLVESKDRECVDLHHILDLAESCFRGRHIGSGDRRVGDDHVERGDAEIVNVLDGGEGVCVEDVVQLDDVKDTSLASRKGSE